MSDGEVGMTWDEGGRRAARVARWTGRLAVVAASVAVVSTMAPRAAGAETCPIELLVSCAGSGAPPAPTSTTTTAPPATTSTTVHQPSAAEAAARLLVLLNAERDHAGLAPFRARDDVAEIASSWSTAMARAGDLAHNDAYFTEATRERLHARLLGENVARNGDVDAAHRALMASPPHRANILDGRFTIVGIGAELREGSWWLTEDFLQPASAVPAPDRPRGTAATSAPPAVPTTARLPVAAPTTPAQDAGEVLGAVASGPTDEWRAPHPAAARRGIAALPGESVLDPRVIAALLAVGVVGVVSMSALRRSDPRRDPAVSARGAKRSRGTNPTRGDARGPGGRRLSAMLASWPERPASSGGPARWRG